jgi:pilus assembly protein Flp/PilA
MRQFAKNVVKFLRAEDGPTAVEYAVLAVILVGITAVGQKTNTTYTTVKNAVPGVS